MAKYVYLFGAGRTEGNAKMKDLLGGKGANLAEMAALGIPVPPGFTITTEVCRYYYKNGGRYPEGLAEQVRQGLQFLEAVTGRRFGDPENPLLVSVRSGAPVSMPGMMDTILNLGLTDRAVAGLAARTSPRFAYDAYRRLLSMYGSVVLGIRDEVDPFGAAMEELKRERGASSDLDLTAEDLRELVERYKAIIRRAGKEFPQDPWEQLWGAIEAVVRSWMNERARVYRRMYRIPEDMGTAVNVQAMVFGNLGNRSGTGVCFTRDPATGENRLYGEFLLNAQGEDVVAGIRTPNPIAKSAKTDPTQLSLEEAMPEVYQELLRIREVLERHYRDMQDVEFTIEEGKLYILQTRAGKRTGFAAVRIAVEMAEEGLITEEEALLRIDPAEQLSQLLQPIFDPKAKARAKVLAKGLAAGPGAASGRIALSAQKAEEMAREGPVILVRHETSPDDIRGMAAAQGILTARGGLTSHAAVVARQIGKVAVVGCEALQLDYQKREVRVAGEVLREGDWLSIDGTTGEVLLGRIPTQPSEVVQVLLTRTLRPEEAPVYRLFAKLMRWADARRKLGVRANADQPDQAAIALAFGAEGIGLCRTEHMFFAEDRIPYMQEALVAPSPEARKRALAALQRMQTQDFEGILRVMDGKPVIIRLLDPPMHEFLPREEKDIRALAERLGMRFEELKGYIDSLQEFNPMLGHRGVRLGITHPDIYDMQVEAIFRAAAKLKKEGLNPKPEVMIPLVGHVNEMRVMRERVVAIAKRVMAEEGVDLPFKVGTMVEVPRAALTADEIAKEAEFFSFGTNDLTQMTFGFSRDDAGKFIREYLERRILPEDPFETLDRNGVGELMRMAVEKGRRVRPDLSVGICGEHGGESRSVHLCHELGLDYVSASPWRIPVARLAAAQAAIRQSLKVEVGGD
ncbi:MAG: pyruvate, phosphate dikinase [Candidatus Bipolaricaulota bacterium]|nr:pyruvate, phosphate dikinase [Candidatus Bipolaricaulota bacterium]MDW8151597.1 pyruvate, phosphate dikinase [Candidatus Bipolaricaulota bacterium]